MIIEAIKQTEKFQMLSLEKKKGSFPKALMLIGKDSFYLQEFARAVAILLLDDSMSLDGENAQKVLASSHPDVKEYPLKDKLLVSDSEEIVLESFVKPIFADKKIFIINNIDNSMEVAQNKLLKVLEEPSKNVYMILTCTSENLVLPTIRSRCNKLEIGRLDDRIIASVLPKLEEEEKKLVLAVAEGQVGKAVSYAKMKNFSLLVRDCVEVFTKMKSSKDVLSHSKKLFSYKDQTALILQVFALVVEDLIKIKSHIKPSMPFEKEYENVSDQFTMRALCEIVLLLEKVAKERQYNVNMTIVIENLLLNILEVKYLCK